MAPNYIVPAVDRTVKVLQALIHHPRGASLSQLTSETGIPKSSLFRILTTLHYHQLVVEDPERQTFSLGMKLVEWGSTVLDRLDLKTIVHPHLVKLAGLTGQSFYLAVVDDYEVILVDRADTPDIWRIVTRLGLRSPVHCTASGLAIIAGLSDTQLDEVVKRKGLPKFTSKTITTKKALVSKLEEVRKMGYAVANGDYKIDLYALAVGIRDHRGKVVASLMTALHSDIARSNKKLVKSLIDSLVQEGRDISKLIGYNNKR